MSRCTWARVSRTDCPVIDVGSVRQLSRPGRSSRTPDGDVVVDVAGVGVRGPYALQVQRLGAVRL